jgi:hypothetical protein
MHNANFNLNIFICLHWGENETILMPLEKQTVCNLWNAVSSFLLSYAAKNNT